MKSYKIHTHLRGSFTRSPNSALAHPFLEEGSPTKIDYSKKGTLILASVLEDLADLCWEYCGFRRSRIGNPQASLRNQSRE